MADLKKELKKRNLSLVGNKNELIERYQSALLDGDSTLDDSALNGDDILDDDMLNVRFEIHLQPRVTLLIILKSALQDDDLDEDEEKSLLDSNHEDAVLKTPPEAEKPIDSLLDSVANKKVILKRKLNITGPSEPAAASSAATGLAGDNILSPAKIAKTTITAPSATDSTTSSSVVTVVNSAAAATTSDGEESGEKKVVKLSTLSAKERLEMRAKKFGVPIAPESAKLARSERFGTAATIDASSTTPASGKTNSANTIKANKEPASVDLLKKRAERFGGSVSKEMSKIENSEKLAKRNERFGSAKTTTQVTVGAKTDAPDAAIPDATAAGAKDEFAEKARLRLERFKTVVV